MTKQIVYDSRTATNSRDLLAQNGISRGDLTEAERVDAVKQCEDYLRSSSGGSFTLKIKDKEIVIPGGYDHVGHFYSALN